MVSSNGRIRIDAADLTLREHAAAMEAAEPFKDQAAASDFVVAAFAWQIRLRTDPTFTFEQACDLKFSDLDFPGTDLGEVPSASIGAPPLSSLVPGESASPGSATIAAHDNTLMWLRDRSWVPSVPL